MFGFRIRLSGPDPHHLLSAVVTWTELQDVSTVYNIQLVFVLQSRAKQLYNAGYKTLTHLANADPAVLSKTIENLYKKQADQIVASAKVSVVHLSAARQLHQDLWRVSRVPDAAEWKSCSAAGGSGRPADGSVGSARSFKNPTTHLSLFIPEEFYSLCKLCVF